MHTGTSWYLGATQDPTVSELRGSYEENVTEVSPLQTSQGLTNQRTQRSPLVLRW